MTLHYHRCPHAEIHNIPSGGEQVVEQDPVTHLTNKCRAERSRKSCMHLHRCQEVQKMRQQNINCKGIPFRLSSLRMASQRFSLIIWRLSGCSWIVEVKVNRLNLHYASANYDNTSDNFAHPDASVNPPLIEGSIS